MIIPFGKTCHIRSKFDRNLVMTLQEEDQQVVMQRLRVEDPRQQWNVVRSAHGLALQSRWSDPRDPAGARYLCAFGMGEPLGLERHAEGAAEWETGVDHGGGFSYLLNKSYWDGAVNFADRGPNAKVGLYSDRIGRRTSCWQLDVARRPRVNDLDPAQQQRQAQALLKYLNDAVVRSHRPAAKPVELLYSAVALAGEIDEFVYAETGRVLASWNPSDAIPAAFQAVKPRDDGRPRAALARPDPASRIPEPLRQPMLARLGRGLPLGQVVFEWDAAVRARVGGALADADDAAAALAYWCWNAWIAELVAGHSAAFEHRPDWEGPATGLACAANHDGRLQLFVNGFARGLYTVGQQAPGSPDWGGWRQIADDCDQAVVARNLDGRLQVCGFTQAGMASLVQDAGGSDTWTEPEDLGGTHVGFALGPSGDGRLELFATNGDGLFNNRQKAPGAGWSGWGSVGGKGVRQPSLAVHRIRDNDTYVLHVGGNGRVWALKQSPNGACAGPRELTSPDDVRQVTAGLNEDGVLTAFALAGDGRLWTSEQDPLNHEWQPFRELVADIAEMCVARNADGKLELFCIDRQRGQVHRLWRRAAQSWEGPAPIGVAGNFTHVTAGRDGAGFVHVFATRSESGVERIHRTWQMHAGDPRQYWDFSVFY